MNEQQNLWANMCAVVYIGNNMEFDPPLGVKCWRMLTTSKRFLSAGVTSDFWLQCFSDEKNPSLLIEGFDVALVADDFGRRICTIGPESSIAPMVVQEEVMIARPITVQ